MYLPELFTPGYLPIGIDLGASGVRMLQLRRRGRSLHVAAAARFELPDRDADPSSDAYFDSIISNLRPRLHSSGFVGRRCVVSFDDRLLRVRSVRHPRMPDDELDRAVALDAPGRLGFTDGEPAEVSWIRAGEVRQGDDLRDEVILVGACRAPIETFIFALAEAGFHPLAVEPGFIAGARSFARFLRRNADQNTVKVIVDIGLRSTGVTFLRGQTVAFHKPLELGGLAMNKAAAERLGLEPQAIIDLRRQRMTPGATPTDPRVDRAIFEAVRPVMVDLANEVSLCLRYFGVSFRGSRPDACLLVGGEAAEPRLTEIVGESLHIPTSIGHPLEGVTFDPRAAAISPDSDWSWTVAAGLSQRILRPLKSAGSDRRRIEDTSARAKPAEPVKRRAA